MLSLVGVPLAPLGARITAMSFCLPMNVHFISIHVLIMHIGAWGSKFCMPSASITDSTVKSIYAVAFATINRQGPNHVAMTDFL